MGLFTEYSSILDDYPRLRSLSFPTSIMTDNSSTPVPTRVPATVQLAILTVDKYARGTRLSSRDDQRDFLDEKVTELVRTL
jgi:hypothetical protein